MIKVPRLRPRWLVKLANSASARRVFAAIYIGSDVVTLGYTAQHTEAAGMRNSIQQAKKRLGGRSRAPSLTQSLTLSHIHRILARLNSSATIAIILPDPLFTHIHLSLPVNLAPQDIGPTLNWALQQQGFAPASDWLWDTRITKHENANEAIYEVLLIETSTVDGFLERLGISRKQLSWLLSDSTLANTGCTELVGPWLSDTQAHQVLTLLHTMVASKHQQRTIQTDLHAEPVASNSGTPLNLACNLITRISKRYRAAFYQVAVAACAISFIGGFWWWQQMNAPLQTAASNPVQLSVPSLPLHPVFNHAHLWQQLHAQNSDKVEVKRLEFRAGRWLLQIQTHNPGFADAWISQLIERLNVQSADVAAQQAASPWQVITNASRTEQALTQIDLELYQ